ncbi:MAG: carotenoid 1,2-hydratase [Nitrospirae bacterium]|nr:carotenoid 1,2-hydratase [Nitrospirota bacterium]
MASAAPEDQRALGTPYGVSEGRTAVTDAEGYREIAPDDMPRLPGAFYYRKDYKIQWWYFTGHLYDVSGREFGYELTFFTVGIQKKPFKSKFGVNNIYIEHFAVSDPSHNKFIFAGSADSGAFGLAGAKDNILDVWTGKASLQGSPQHMHIKATADTGSPRGRNDATLDLVLSPEKPLVLNGEHGYSRKSALSPQQASFYFSYTRLKTEGTITLGGSAVTVKGESWFDREISSYHPLWGATQGWDWFSVQLNDRREIMLYLLRNRDGSVDPYSSGTFVYDTGRYKHLKKEEFTINVLRHYLSKKTGARYPAEWEIIIPSEKVSLKITPLIEDQEFDAASTTGNSYWEGTCIVKGTTEGRAYVELTGY